MQNSFAIFLSPVKLASTIVFFCVIICLSEIEDVFYCRVRFVEEGIRVQ